MRPAWPFCHAGHTGANRIADGGVEASRLETFIVRDGARLLRSWINR